MVLYILLILFFIGFYISDLGKIIRFIFTICAIKSIFDNIFINFSLVFWLFIFILLFNIPIVFKLSSIFIKKFILSHR